MYYVGGASGYVLVCMYCNILCMCAANIFTLSEYIILLLWTTAALPASSVRDLLLMLERLLGTADALIVIL